MTNKEKKSKIADILMDFQEEYSNEVVNRPMLASLYAGNILSFIDSLQDEPVSEDLVSVSEELSRLYVLPFLDKNYEKYGEHKQMELTRFDGYDIMSAYEEGFHQAEKDLELIWEDIEKIVNLYEDIHLDFSFEGKGDLVNTKEHYQEVLKCFKKGKRNDIKRH